ncbi:MAG TPA: hypothetical protein VLK65_06095 [Vicinamibacteria bacterium]|nr:hypothetical protein [Vicinamibacteria bacterium]
MISRSRAWRIIKVAIGLVLLPLGIIGLFVPVLQGVLFLLVGFMLLASEIPWFERYQQKLHARYPQLFEKAHRLRDRFQGWFR